MKFKRNIRDFVNFLIMIKAFHIFNIMKQKYNKINDN